MARKGAIKKKKAEPDKIYNDVLVTKLINRSMFDGKKSTAEGQVYRAFEIVKEQTKAEPMQIFHEALDKIRPSMEVRPRRVGGASYQVPMPVRGVRQNSLAIRWLIEAARGRDNKDYHTFAEKLAAEIIDATKEDGGAYKKRIEMERVAEANRAFAHFRW